MEAAEAVALAAGEQWSFQLIGLRPIRWHVAVAHLVAVPAEWAAGPGQLARSTAIPAQTRHIAQSADCAAGPDELAGKLAACCRCNMQRRHDALDPPVGNFPPLLCKSFKRF